ncbi:site-specific integrase [Rapidithrix thailandica]|uniref:Site-specific integrase n=1 Tax=Rapidithrix thailandica TaxID=413964 RepID=A0AAW9S0N1_9BACT
MKLYSDKGERLYLTASERQRFEQVSKQQDRETMTFALVLLYTGCRLSEALNLQVRHIDLENHSIGIESLKKRKKGVFRSIPVPERLIESLNLVHALRETKNKNARLWKFTRMTGWRKIKEIMATAKIQGPQATAKGLRHGFGVYAIADCEIPLNMVQKWLGHAELKTTAIYANAVGKEERDIANKMWRR